MLLAGALGDRWHEKISTRPGMTMIMTFKSEYQEGRRQSSTIVPIIQQDMYKLQATVRLNGDLDGNSVHHGCFSLSLPVSKEPSCIQVHT